MEMPLRQSTLVFLTVIVSAMVISGQNPVILDKEKRKVEIPAGSPLILNCKLSTKEHQRYRISWNFRPYGSNKSNILSERISNGSAKVFNMTSDTEDTLLNHTSNATDRNSGWYSCTVTAEIPMYNFSNSTETEVFITKSVELTTHPSLPIVTGKQETVPPTDSSRSFTRWQWILLGVSAVVLIFLLFMCILLRGRCRRSRGEDPVYANTRRMVNNKQPSPRPGMPVDHLKTFSSTQNLRTPSPGRRYDEGRGRYKE